MRDFLFSLFEVSLTMGAVTALLLAFVLLTVCFRGVRHESL